MRPAFHIFASLAGALIFGAAGAAWCAMSERGFEAGALTIVQSGATAPAPLALESLRALVASEPVLRRAALRPEAAAIVEKSARLSGLDRLAALVRSQPSDIDTLSRAVTMLAQHVDLRPGPRPDTIEILARLPSATDAAAVATAVAESFVAEIKAIDAQASGRTAQARGQRLDQAARRLEAAQGRLQALRAADPVSTAALAPARARPPGEVRPDLAPLQRAAAEATASLTEAARVYGPRHPRLVEADSAARRAQTALQTAQRAAPDGARRKNAGATTAPAREISEGGPDPRAGEIAAAEQEAAQAEAAYDLEMARTGADRREARVAKPASVPIGSRAPSGLAIVGGSALLGFLLMGVAPNVTPASRGSTPRRRIADRRLARMRDGALDWVAAERVLEILGVGDGRTARIVKVAGDDADLASAGARALALAALAAGWRPLLVAQAGAGGRRSDPARRAIALAGATCVASKVDTSEGPLFVAVPGRRSSAAAGVDAVDAALAFDLVVVDAGRAEGARARNIGGRADRIVRVAAGLSDAEATGLLARLDAEADRFAGTILTARGA